MVPQSLFIHFVFNDVLVEVLRRLQIIAMQAHITKTLRGSGSKCDLGLLVCSIFFPLLTVDLDLLRCLALLNRQTGGLVGSRFSCLGSFLCVRERTYVENGEFIIGTER